MTIKKKHYQYIVVVVLTALLLTIYFSHRNRNQDKVFIESKAIKTKDGWGYNILIDGKTYIHQEFIPAIAEKHSFKTKEDALLVGREVIKKISTNQLPSITVDDLKELGIIKDSATYK